MTGPEGTHGFSLIELMVVVAVTSVLAISTTLIFGRGSDAATRLAADFQADTVALRRLAMITGADHRLELAPGGWRSMRAGAGGDWSALNAHSVTDLQAPRKSVLFRRDGWVEGFDVTLGLGDARVACRSANGEIPRCDGL